MSTHRSLQRAFGSSVILATTLCLTSGCHIPTESASEIFVVNNTSETLIVQDPGAEPSQPPDSPDVTTEKVWLKPGEQAGFAPALDPGNCVLVALMAYDTSGKLFASYPSPICLGKHQRPPFTWAITGPGQGHVTTG